MRFKQVRKVPSNINLWAVPELVQHITPNWFDLNWWQQQGVELKSASGRGKSYFIDYEIEGETVPMVWRHYLRGGKAASVSEDKYLWLGLDRTRAYQETFLTSELYERGLPVPKPLAAMVVRKGLRYSADFLTERIPNSETLADRLIAGEAIDWYRVGDTVGRFHVYKVDHSDLNCRNILIDDEQETFLIDFDRCFFRVKDKGWREKNLLRLESSLNKLVDEGILDASALVAGLKTFLEGYNERWLSQVVERELPQEKAAGAEKGEAAEHQQDSANDATAAVAQQAADQTPAATAEPTEEPKQRQLDG